MENNGVIINDNDKLFDIGFQDGYERAVKILESNPENFNALQIVELPSYKEGYKEGMKEALKEYQSQSNPQR